MNLSQIYKRYPLFKKRDDNYEFVIIIVIINKPE